MTRISSPCTCCCCFDGSLAIKDIAHAGGASHERPPLASWPRLHLGPVQRLRAHASAETESCVQLVATSLRDGDLPGEREIEVQA